MQSDKNSRFPFRQALSAIAAATALSATLVGCGQNGSDSEAPDEGKNPKTTSTNAKVLWLGDSIAGAEAPAVGAALKASGAKFKDASSDGGGTVVDSGEEITRMISADTWKQLAKDVDAFNPTVIAYQVTTYDWGSQDQQRASYEKLVSTAKESGAKVVFVPTPPIKIDEFYTKYEAQMRTAPKVAREVAEKSGGSALYFDSSQVWGTDASSEQAQRSSDGIHNCQQGAAAFATWFSGELGKELSFTPAPVDDWANGSWTGSKQYGKLKCES